MKIVIFGAPGSGKGTVAQKIEQEFHFPQISTGDILREETKKKTPLGKQISKAMQSGKYVEDEVMFNILKNRLKKADCKKGFILDGYPRTNAQAEFLINNIDIDIVFCLDVSEKEIINRILNRMVCPKCRAIYNKKTYEKNICQKCGEKLVKRQDDTLEIITKRIEFYKKETLPVINLFKDKVIKIGGKNKNSSEQIYNQIREEIIKRSVK